MQATITRRESGCTPRIMRREWNTIHRDAARSAGAYWHREFRPLHFTRAAFRLYSYQPRTWRYSKWKLRVAGHTNPLVGPRRRNAPGGASQRASEIQDIRATAVGGQMGTAKVRIVMHTPVLNLRANSNAPDMRKELTTVAPSELATLGRETELFLEHRYEFLRATTITRLDLGRGQM